MSFTKKKFLSLPEEQQHKKCAELLLELYNEWAAWIGSTPLESPEVKKVSDRYHQHLKQANVHLKEHNLLPEIRKGDKEVAAERAYPIAIYLDNIRSAHNVGSILRTTEALQLGEIHLSEATPNHEHPQVAKTSMGASEWVNCEKQADLKNLPKPVIALETSKDATPLFEFEFPESFTLVLGNEEYGCSDKTLQVADHLVEIPLRGRKNSLNVANAFAIAAAEIVRQRRRSNEIS